MNIIDLRVTAQDGGTTRVSVSLEIPDDDASISDRMMERIRLYIPEFLTREDDFFDKKK